MDDVDLQWEIYGRELDDDEIYDLVDGINGWYSIDFLLRCMVERRMAPGRFHNVFSSNGDDVEWEYPPATEKARRRFPDAQLIKDSSWAYFFVEPWGASYTAFGFHRMIQQPRTVVSIYYDAVEGTHIEMKSKVDFETCEPLGIERIKLGKEPNYRLGTSYIPKLEDHTPLKPHEVGYETDETAKVTAR